MTETSGTNGTNGHSLTNGNGTATELLVSEVEAAAETAAKYDREYRLTKELVKEATTFHQAQVRAAVDLYYAIQKVRVGARLRESAHQRRTDILADSRLVSSIKDRLEEIEEETVKPLTAYVKSQPLGQWMMSIAGMGPVLAAGFMAHIDFHRCTCIPYRGMRQDEIPPHQCRGLATAGAIWKFCGQLDPRLQQWEKGQRRPYNLKMKVHCFKLGESFKMLVPSAEKRTITDAQIYDQILKDHAKKSSTPLDGETLAAEVQKRRAKIDARLARLFDDPSYLYAQLYMKRKEQEVRYNSEGRFAELARQRLAQCKQRRARISPEQEAIWSSGKLQDKGLDLRAMRYAVRIFLSHFHQVGREIIFGDRVTPWIIAHGGHSHYLPPPNWPLPQKKPRRTSKVLKASKKEAVIAD